MGFPPATAHFRFHQSSFSALDAWRFRFLFIPIWLRNYAPTTLQVETWKLLVAALPHSLRLGAGTWCVCVCVFVFNIYIYICMFLLFSFIFSASQSGGCNFLRPFGFPCLELPKKVLPHNSQGQPSFGSQTHVCLALQSYIAPLRAEVRVGLFGRW